MDLLLWRHGSSGHCWGGRCGGASSAEAGGVLSSSKAPWKEAMPPGCAPRPCCRQGLQPGNAEPRSSLPNSTWTAAEEPTVSSGNKTEWAGGTSHKKRLSAPLNRFFSPRTTPGKGWAFSRLCLSPLLTKHEQVRAQRGMQSPRGPAFPQKPSISKTDSNIFFCSASAVSAETLAAKTCFCWSARAAGAQRCPSAPRHAVLHGTLAPGSPGKQSWEGWHSYS